MADFAKPTVGDSYTLVPGQVRDLCADIAKWLDGTGSANTPTGAKRWNTNKFERYDGASWLALAALYDINVQSVQGSTPGNGSGNLAINNGTLCTNLNAALLNGLVAGNGSGQIALSNGSLCANLNADMLDGLDSLAFARLNGSNTRFTGHVLLAGSLSLPATVQTNELAFAAGYGSPVAGKFLWGDGSGWRLQFGRRVGGSEVIVIQMYDNGNLDIGGALSASAAISSASTITASGLLYGRGGGRGLGQITLSSSDPSGGANGDVWFKF